MLKNEMRTSLKYKNYQLLIIYNNACVEVSNKTTDKREILLLAYPDLNFSYYIKEIALQSVKGWKFSDCFCNVVKHCIESI